jgi:hypothetical protein
MQHERFLHAHRDYKYTSLTHAMCAHTINICSDAHLATAANLALLLLAADVASSIVFASGNEAPSWNSFTYAPTYVRSSGAVKWRPCMRCDVTKDIEHNCHAVYKQSAQCNVLTAAMKFHAKANVIEPHMQQVQLALAPCKLRAAAM